MNILQQNDFMYPEIKDLLEKLVDALNAIPTTEPVTMDRIEVQLPKQIAYLNSDFIIKETIRDDIVLNHSELPKGVSVILVAFPCLWLRPGAKPKKLQKAGDKK